MRTLKYLGKSFVAALVAVVCCTVAVYAIDSDETKRTLTGIEGVSVVVEELQPNVQKYARKFGIQRDQIKADIETTLKKTGIRVLTYDQWLKTPGRPFLYVVVNTHEYEKYWYAYDIKVELSQRVLLEINPSLTTMAATWSMNMTGITNIGKLNLIKEGLGMLMKRFVEAHQSANRKIGR